jgi:hypothetical protein
VIAGGVASTAVCLLIVYLLANFVEGFEVMGWYVWFIIPVGAALVGIGAGSGYGLVSWLTGRKVGGGLLFAVLLIQIVSYCAAQWIEFKSYDLVYDNGEAVTFFEYHDTVTRSTTFTSRHSDDPSKPIGRLGYVFRILELAAFALGGLLIPLLLRAKPYCEDCRTYMKTRTLGMIPASIDKRKIPKGDTHAQAAYEAELEEAFQRGLSSVEALGEAATKQDASVIREIVREHSGQLKETGKLLHRIRVAVSECPDCSSGILRCEMLSGQGDKLETQELFATPVSSGVVQALA